jgi:hypothetical protein
MMARHSEVTGYFANVAVYKNMWDGLSGGKPIT